LIELAQTVDIMPPLEADAIDPGNHVVVLGQLTVAERKKLVVELRALAAPQAGYGGASASDGVGVGWLALGTVFLLLSLVAGLAARGRRRSGPS
jgi:hypothetical protein